MSDKGVTIDFLIRQNFYKYQRLYNQKAMEYGVSISVGYVLLMVEKEGTPSTQLGPKMGMESTSLSRTLKLMEDDGLIRRVLDTVDKRKVLIFLTEQGVEKRRIAKEVVLGFDEKLIKIFPKDKLSSFYKMMHQIDDFLENELKK
ncbi:MAG: MarR family transcriptional regulator [Flavobacteriia bacterium]|nr:MarR family transcriptional regulator [Flavobacteriia bacterium]